MRTYGVALLLPLLFNVSMAAERREQARPGITVLVCDKVGLAPDILQAAPGEARKVFQNAGVDLVWRYSEGDRTPTQFLPSSFEGCSLPSVDADFLVVLSTESPKDWPADVLGYSIRTRTSPQRVYVLYDAIKKLLARKLDTKGPTLVGHVVAHELGHLLLSETQHTPNGIMSSGWGYQDITRAAQGWLRFDPVQAKRIRAEAQIRSAQKLARPPEASVLRSARNSREIDK